MAFSPTLRKHKDSSVKVFIERKIVAIQSCGIPSLLLGHFSDCAETLDVAAIAVFLAFDDVSIASQHLMLNVDLGTCEDHTS